jgi:hypothetical protein
MKRCPACQRTYEDDTLSYCLEDGAALLNDASASSDLAATIIIPEPRITTPVKPETYRPAPPPQVYAQPAPSWSPAAMPPHALASAPARQGRGAAVTSLIFAISAFVMLGFCILGGATGVNEELIGGVFIFSVLLALAGTVLGIIATSRSSKDTSAQNAKTISIVALALNGLYLLITIVFLILAAVVQNDS